MPRGGARPGAGRPKGPKSAAQPVQAAAKVLRRAAEAPSALPPAAAALKRFETALEFAMATINDPEADMGDKVKLAIAALPFQHPRIEAAAKGKKELRDEAAKKAATGRFASPPPPGAPRPN